MPCVLPVMGMKLNSILQAGSDRRAIRLRFLATSADPHLLMLLAGMVTALKLAGASLGWGIQFQNPWFIGLMVAVTFLFALNLFGAFEMLLPSAAAGRLATAGERGLAAASAKGCVRHAAGNAVLRAVPRYGGRLCPWRAAARPVADLPDARRGHEPAVAVCRPGAENGHAAAQTRPLDEHAQGHPGLMMLASSLWLATLLSVHLGEAVSQIVMLGLIAVARCCLR
jgi:suppressor for copper-sensitivity B